MANLTKPSIKSEWRGQTGNKFRVWIVINSEGNRHVRMNKELAHKQYEASVRVYKKRLKR